MRIGVPKEIKNNENRVGMTPAGAGTLVEAGHELRVESGAGLGAGFSDPDYESVGARVVDAATTWKSDLVIKVKEPLASNTSAEARQRIRGPERSVTSGQNR